VAENKNPPDRKRQKKELPEEVGVKERRKIKARRERDRGVWFGFGMFGMVGWAVAIPTLIFIGIVIGCLNAWYWVKRESRHD